MITGSSFIIQQVLFLKSFACSSPTLHYLIIYFLECLTPRQEFINTQKCKNVGDLHWLQYNG